MSVFSDLYPWMVFEIILSTLFYCIFLALKHSNFSAPDRFLYLKYTFFALLGLPILCALIPTNLFSNLILDNSFQMIMLDNTLNLVSPDTHGNALIPPSSTTDDHFLSSMVANLFCILYFLILCHGLYKMLRSHFILKSIVRNGQITAIAGQNNICIHSEDLPPATMGTFKPLILLPKLVYENYSNDQIALILSHENIHIQRFDYAINLLGLVLKSILFFSPFIHLLHKHLMEEMELSCDELVLATATHQPNPSQLYGNILIELSSQSGPRLDLAYSGLFFSNSFFIQEDNCNENYFKYSST